MNLMSRFSGRTARSASLSLRDLSGTKTPLLLNTTFSNARGRLLRFPQGHCLYDLIMSGFRNGNEPRAPVKPIEPKQIIESPRPPIAKG